MSLILKILILVSLKIVTHQAATVSCNDTFLISQNCTCSITFSGSAKVESMSCGGSYLTNLTQNTLPGISTSSPPLGMQIAGTYTMFPIAPVSYLSLYNLMLDNNQIPSLNQDFTNLVNLLTFYISYNLITQIPSQLGCMLPNVQRMDLSYNLIQAFYFDYLVCQTNTSVLNTTSNYVFSSLQELILAGNLIKVNKSSNFKIF